MNKNQIEGAARKAAGKVEKAFGQAVGSQRRQASGAEQELVGPTQKTAGDLQAAATKADKKMIRGERKA